MKNSTLGSVFFQSCLESCQKLQIIRLYYTDREVGGLVLKC